MLDIGVMRILVCIPFLLYACYSDLKNRRVSNLVWLPMIGVGAVLALLDFIDHGFISLLNFGLSVMLISAFAYVLFKMGAFGGADAKAIISLAIVVPTFHPIRLFEHSIPLAGIPPLNLFAFSTFGNALILTSVVPFFVFIYNLVHLNRDEMMEKPAYLFLGYKSKISELKNRRHIRLMENYVEEGGRVIRKFSRRGIAIDEEVVETLQRFAKEGKIPERIWITPGLPFMIPLTLGFITAVVYGDFIYLIIISILGT
ncbi:MAG: A24 family peptidase C-terminal domain-containing protein [Methanosarcinales archaeon Met12]|nr:MAG: A24 family peptidase C-terminal domain-containing protein [Methanosarcinales archaeon Met12]